MSDRLPDGWQLRNRLLARLQAALPDRQLASMARLLVGAVALEIGGPSAIFGPRSGLALYSALGALDGCNFAESTLWSGQVTADAGVRARIVAEAASLPVPDGAYDAVLASHVIEHIADPLGALVDWRRVLAPSGRLLLVVPHRDGTFDHRRPVTSLDHLRRDADRRTGEDDLTHVPEILDLHDRRRDPGVGGLEDFVARCHRNAALRALHHHVFVTQTVIDLCAAAGFTVERLAVRRPFHIICLARLLTPGAAAPGSPARVSIRERSPFPSDRPVPRETEPVLTR